MCRLPLVPVAQAHLTAVISSLRAISASLIPLESLCGGSEVGHIYDANFCLPESTHNLRGEKLLSEQGLSALCGESCHYIVFAFK